MKKIFHISTLAVLTAFWGCSSDKGDITNSWDGIEFDLYGVSKWEDANFEVKKFYTLVDTITLKNPSVSLVIKADRGIETSVAWTIDGTARESIRIDEPATASQGIVISTFLPYLDDQFEYKDGMPVKAMARVGQYSVTRNQAISEDSDTRDVLYVNFGMSAQEVLHQIEAIRGTDKFFMRNTGLGYEERAPHFLFTQPGRTLYIFDNDRLAEVAEFPSSVFTEGGEVEPSFTAFCKRLGMKSETVPVKDGMLTENPEWEEREGIVIRLVMRDDVFEWEGQDGYMENSIGISYIPR